MHPIPTPEHSPMCTNEKPWCTYVQSSGEQGKVVSNWGTCTKEKPAKVGA